MMNHGALTTDSGIAVFSSILVLWFGVETKNLCQKLSPDEYMQAIVLYVLLRCMTR